MILTKSRRPSKGSRPRTETVNMPYESLLKMIMTDVEFVSIGKLEPEISLVKGVPSLQTGGTPSRQSGGHMSPGGECFDHYRHGAQTHVEATGIARMDSEHIIVAKREHMLKQDWYCQHGLRTHNVDTCFANYNINNTSFMSNKHRFCHKDRLCSKDKSTDGSEMIQDMKSTHFEISGTAAAFVFGLF